MGDFARLVTWPNHLDGDERPTPARFSSRREVLALGAAAGELGRGSIVFLPPGVVRGYSDDDQEFQKRETTRILHYVCLHVRFSSSRSIQGHPNPTARSTLSRERKCNWVTTCTTVENLSFGRVMWSKYDKFRHVQCGITSIDE